MSTKEFGCFFCHGKSADEEGTCSECARPINIGNELRAVAFQNYTPRSIIGRGFYGWTLRVEDEYQFFAIKVVPTHRLAGRQHAANKEARDQEARALVQCSLHRNLARFFRGFSANVSVLDRKIEVFCMVFDYIDNARPLSKLVADDNLRLTAGDVVGILAGVASGLARMHTNGLWHDDLHDDNVLVRTVQSDENLNERFESKIIDFGSTKPRRPDEPEHGERGDYFYLAKHIDNVVARFELGNVVTRTPSDRVFGGRLRQLAREIADRNVSRRRLEPPEIITRIHDALRIPGSAMEFPPVDTMLAERSLSFKQPFENPNALHLEPQDIGLLFIDELGWTKQVSKAQPVIIVGPRGCGKTMLLRHLSLRSQGRPRKAEDSRQLMVTRLSGADFIGILVRCSDLRTPFFRSSFKKLQATDPARAEDFCREYINLHFALELSRSVAWLATENLAPITERDVGPLVGTLAKLLEPEESALLPALSLPAMLEAVERRCVALSNLKDTDSYQPTNYCRDDVLDQLAVAVRSAHWFSTKEIWFLLDDYSVPLLPEFVQRAYNPALFRLSSSFRLKVSSEGEGPRLEDTFGRRYREGREFSRLNLGEIYFRRDERGCREFLEKIIAARFTEAASGSIRDLQRLLGEHPNESGFGRYICEHKRPGDARFFGFGLLCHLCSGDIGSILELFDKLYNERVNARDGTLRPADQDKITKSFAQEELRTLRQIHEWGPRLHDFATRVGQLLKEHLLRSRDQDRADERLRIEIEGPGDLSDVARATHDQLLQHSVLISGGAGKSRAGLPTQKYFFRRLYAPCFPFSPARRGCIALKIGEYNRWLQDSELIVLDPKKPPYPGDTEDDDDGNN